MLSVQVMMLLASRSMMVDGSPMMIKMFSRMQFGIWKILYPVKNIGNKKVLPLQPEKLMNQLILIALYGIKK
jgi:hypothetical protein